MQQTSQEIYETKYQLKNQEGTPIDKDLDDTFKRVAKALASTEKESKYWEQEFLTAMRNGAIPAGRILSNAGAEAYKPNTSLINCTVSGEVSDDVESIGQMVKESMMTLAKGCGIGYCFSSLRPKGALVGGVGATTSGSLSFMNIFDSGCFTISSAGGRRGAQMGTMHVWHPDILDFIKAKREDGKFRQFNMSVLLTDEFMRAKDNDEDWQLYFPLHKKETGCEVLHIENFPFSSEDYVYAGFTEDNLYTSYDPSKHKEKLVACKIYKTIKARELWDLIMKSTYEFAEPGVLFIDRINESNPLNCVETISSTNPCGEQPLPNYGSCLLGSLLLHKFVKNPFVQPEQDLDSLDGSTTFVKRSWGGAEFDWELFDKTTRTFVRMLDNVVELNGLALPAQRQEILSKRRHGMGFTGLGTALAMLGIPYGGKEAIEFCEEVSKRIAVINLEENYKLGEEKGCAPVFNDDIVYERWLRHNFTQNVLQETDLDTTTKSYTFLEDETLRPRFTHASSIAPTGTLSLAIGNNCSNGIEPTFAHSYKRNVIVEGKATKEQVDVYSAEALAWRELHMDGYGIPELPDYFVEADSLTPEQHIAMQAAAQKWVDSSISKCIAKGTRVITSAGILPIEELGLAEREDTFASPLEGLKVLNEDGNWYKVTAHYYAGKKEAIKVKLSNGQMLIGSPVHKVKTYDGSWITLGSLQINDVVLANLPNVSYIGNKELPYSDNTKIPAYMTEDLALWLGMWLADGSNSSNSVSFHNSKREHIQLWSDLSKKLFGKIGAVCKDSRNDVKTVSINSKSIVAWLTAWVGAKALGKKVPSELLSGSQVEWLAFLKGISLDGYSTNNGNTYLYFGKSEQIAESIFYICSALGYAPRLQSKEVDGYDYKIYGCSVKGFDNCLDRHKNTPVPEDRRYLAPLAVKAESFKVATNHPYYYAWRNINQRNHKSVKPQTLANFALYDSKTIEALKVQSIEYVVEDLYDIEVEEVHSYLVGGVISHNTVNCPTNLSFEDFKKVYDFAYASGLKGCTTFRFNPEAFSGVLVKEADLEGTLYEFTLEDGTLVTFKGSETVIYDGAEHNVANLFDALKEGYYGKF